MSFNLLLYTAYQIAGENSETEEELLALGIPFLCTHTLGGVGWELPPRGPHWDLLTTKVEQLQFISPTETLPVSYFTSTYLQRLQIVS